MKTGLRHILRLLLDLLVLPVLAVATVFVPKRKAELTWGPVPLISNRYWSDAMRQAGWTSRTLMHGYYKINSKADFDLYFDELVPKWLGPGILRAALAPYFAFVHVIANSRVIHIPFSGGPLGNTFLWRLEAPLFKFAGIKTVVMAYGSDVYMYSRIRNPSLANALLISYPQAALEERRIARKVEYWTRYGDIVIPMFMSVDGIGRWDITVPSAVSINTRSWMPKTEYSAANGRNAPVRVVHAPNHPGVKGTEFLVRVIDELRGEGLQIDFVLLQGVPNERVRLEMLKADIVAEQFIAGMYGLTAIEGMACGLPVLANLEEDYTRFYRRYAYLDECPILSTPPESLAGNLRALVTDPALREQLGRAGRHYVEKYHSYAAAQHLFGSIYRKILGGENVDLMNLFHPLESEYRGRTPPVRHPLVENRLPPERRSPC